MASVLRRMRRGQSSTRAGRYITAGARGSLPELDVLRLQLALTPPPVGLTRERRKVAAKRVRFLEAATAAGTPDAVTPAQFLNQIGVKLTPAQGEMAS